MSELDTRLDLVECAHRHSPPLPMHMRATDNDKCQIGVRYHRSECEGFSQERLQIRLQYLEDNGRSVGFLSVITPLLNVISGENRQDKQMLFRSDSQTRPGLVLPENDVSIMIVRGLEELDQLLS